MKNLMWKNKYVEDMTREELIEALIHSMHFIEQQNKNTDRILELWEMHRKARSS